MSGHSRQLGVVHIRPRLRRTGKGRLPKKVKPCESPSKAGDLPMLINIVNTVKADSANSYKRSVSQ